MSVSRRSDTFKPWLFIFSCAALVWACFLLYAGGFTTSIQAGMAFLDWPLSNGSLNPDGWLTEQDQLAEHSHRLLGMKLGFLTIVSLVWHFFREARARVRWASYVLFWVVLSQGLLGGARVVFDQLNTGASSNVVAQTFAVAHACGAQVVFCILVGLAVVHSPFWHRHAGSPPEIKNLRDLRLWGWVGTLALFAQILIGAVVRHNHAGLAISTFPLATESSLFPAVWNFPISIHFAHRVGAVIVTAILIFWAVRLVRNHGARRYLWGNTALMLAVLALQIYLGALTIWTGKNPHAATFHMLVGAFLLGAAWLLTVRLYRFRVAGVTALPAALNQASRLESPVLAEG